jgi:hypothetical protein
VTAAVAQLAMYADFPPGAIAIEIGLLKERPFI